MSKANQINKVFNDSEILDSVLQQNKLLIEKIDLVLKSNANLRQDFREIVKDAISSVLTKRNTQAYSRISGG